jgi:hypothetical protein
MIRDILVFSSHSISFVSFSFAVLGFETQGLHLEPLHQHFSCMMDSFAIGSHELFSRDPPDLCLLSSRIIGMSHQLPAVSFS